MKDRIDHLGQEPEGVKFNLFEKLVSLSAIQDTRDIFGKYNIDRRLKLAEGDILFGYFTHYRLLRSQENENLFDMEKDIEKDILYKFPQFSFAARWIDTMANSIRKVSKWFKDESDRKFEENFGNIDPTELNVTQSKLLRVANMMNVHLRSDKSRREKDQTIRDYLDRELPIKQEPAEDLK